MTRPGDALCASLRGYKDAPAAQARLHHADALATMLRSFLARCGAGMVHAPAGWDLAVVVPSSRRRSSSAHPLAAVAARAGLAVSAAALTLQAGTGTGTSVGAPAHLRPRPAALGVAGELERRRVLVLDDTWTTGAHALSAVGALRRAGASVAAVVVLGRLVDPEAAPDLAAWWATATAGRSR
jgi:predicted amidophosphoribosyltransferase